MQFTTLSFVARRDALLHNLLLEVLEELLNVQTAFGTCLVALNSFRSVLF